jgi:hypothetical protein
MQKLIWLDKEYLTGRFNMDHRAIYRVTRPIDNCPCHIENFVFDNIYGE